MEYYEFLQNLWDCGSKEIFHILSAKSGDWLHNHFISKVMLTAVFSPWQSFSAGFGKLHFWPPLLEAAMTAWWSQVLHVGPGPKFGELAGILLDEEPADKLAVPQGECSPGTSPVRGTNPFVLLRSTGRIRIPPNVTGVCAWTLSAGTGWFERFPPPEGGRGALGWPGSQPVEEETLHRCARPRRFSAPFCQQNIWRWESSPKICWCRFLKTL